MPACGVRSLVRYRVEHEKAKFISTRGHVISSISTEPSCLIEIKGYCYL